MRDGHYSTDGPICPFCDHTQCPDEPLYWDEMTTEMECGQCEKVYNVRIYIQTSWTTMVPEIDRLKGDV